MLLNSTAAVIDHQPLITPRELISALPAPERIAQHVRDSRQAIADVVQGRDEQRLVVVVGPCSIHDPDAAFDYASRLARVAESASDALLVVMRTYLEKPRTALGWKGFVADPDLDGRCDFASGLVRARELLLAINGLGLACGAEVLDPLMPAFLADLLSWAGIGARTAESPTHRQLASGLAMPVGFKNGIDGSLETASNGVIAARSSHRFPGVDASGRSTLVTTRGNSDAHVVLRGGRNGTNFDRTAVAHAAELVGPDGPPRAVWVDCSHANSGKDPARQRVACRAVLEQVREPNPVIGGLLLESNLAAGRQDWQPGIALKRGVSITDACIGWSETQDLLGEIALAARETRPQRGHRVQNRLRHACVR
jgi:3-deoxy-7-phosphoheptulonate synthase